jgi:hypothetical protein
LQALSSSGNPSRANRRNPLRDPDTKVANRYNIDVTRQSVRKREAFQPIASDHLAFALRWFEPRRTRSARSSIIDNRIPNSFVFFVPCGQKSISTTKGTKNTKNHDLFLCALRALCG